MTYDLKKAQAICDTISTCTDALSKIAKKHGLDRQTIYQWRVKYPEFDKMYFDAKKRQVSIMVDEIQDDVDDMCTVALRGSGNCNAYVQAKKIALEQKRWLAVKLLPNIYGERAQQDDSSADAEIDAQLQDAREVYRKQTKKEY